MKRIILLFSFIVFSFAVFSQTSINAFAAQYGTWDGEKWELYELMEVDIDFILDDNLITAYDFAGSSYFTYEVLASDELTVQWKAVDDMLEECVVVMTVDGEYQVLIIIYTDILYKYVYTVKS